MSSPVPLLQIPSYLHLPVNVCSSLKSNFSQSNDRKVVSWLPQIHKNGILFHFRYDYICYFKVINIKLQFGFF